MSYDYTKLDANELLKKYDQRNLLETKVELWSSNIFKTPATYCEKTIHPPKIDTNK